MQNIFLAKFGDEEKWLPLSQHLKDTADVCKYLCRQYVCDAMATAAGLEREEFDHLAVFLSAVHDIGKATAAFQGKICAGTKHEKILLEQGFSVTRGEGAKDSPHALAGGAILNRVFHVDESICDVIAAHHGKPRLSGKEGNFERQFTHYSDNYYFSAEYEKKYKREWEEIYNFAIRESNCVKAPKISVTAQMILSGLVIMSDWIASNEDYFPLFTAHVVEDTESRSKDALRELDIPSAWCSSYAEVNEEIFKDRFGFVPNEIQRAAINISASMQQIPGIMIIEAPMGLGKTEAALAAAETESFEAGSGGVFFGLPTQGTANGMFPRFIDWAKNVSDGMKISLSLAHGSAKENELFSSVASGVADEDGLQVNAWMAGRHRALLPDFVTGTIDQALMSALKKKFVMLLHLGLCGKVVIVDEVHSYDAYMSVYMDKMLSWLGAYKTPVILLSATLTKQKRNEFLSAYLGNEEVNIESDAYPCISWTEAGKAFIKEIQTENIRKATVKLRYTAEDDIPSLIMDRLDAGGCAGVVIDTVRAAQNLFTELKENLPQTYTVVLLHSRFLPQDRTRIENKVLELVGKGSKNRNCIVIVGTQVLEQSLDLDFDIMFTDKCPVDLLLQRIGRLHRHERTRPEKLKDAICYIINDAEAAKRATYPYDEYIIRRTDEELGKKERIVLPDDIRGLTEDVYELSKGDDAKDKVEYVKKIKESSLNASPLSIPTPQQNIFRGMLDVAEVKGDGGVRDGINNMDLILLKKTDDGIEPLDNTRTKKEIQELFKQKLSVRYDEKMYNEIKVKMNNATEKLMRDPMLSEELVVILDKDGKTKIGEKVYSYSSEYGWREER